MKTSAQPCALQCDHCRAPPRVCLRCFYWCLAQPRVVTWAQVNQTATQMQVPGSSSRWVSLSVPMQPKEAPCSEGKEGVWD